MWKVDEREFKELPLRVHEILARVPLHDVWAVDLICWRRGITLSQFLETARLDSIPTSPCTRFLMRCRFSVGRALGWDRTAPPRTPVESESGTSNKATIIHRISAADYRNSLVEPGTLESGFNIVYSFANERLVELRNRSVHAALVVALQERERDYRLYLGVYVFNVNRWTPLYMAAIAPFRRWIVYPALLQGFRRKWDERFGNHGACD